MAGKEYTNRDFNPKGTFFAVYDACITGNVPSRDVAFIEERSYSGNIHEQVTTDEKYFRTLKDAKGYVNNHFQSGAEYFSLKQSTNADNILFTLIDKITYLFAWQIKPASTSFNKQIVYLFLAGSYFSNELTKICIL